MKISRIRSVTNVKPKSEQLEPKRKDSLELLRKLHVKKRSRKNVRLCSKQEKKLKRVKVMMTKMIVKAMVHVIRRVDQTQLDHNQRLQNLDQGLKSLANPTHKDLAVQSPRATWGQMQKMMMTSKKMTWMTKNTRESVTSQVSQR